jgi:hypothetical protein
MGASVSATYFTGGAMIYGHRHQGGNFAYDISNSGDELILDLKPGTWSFHVIGWDGANPMTGVVRCGKIISQEIQGKEQDLQFTINNPNCADTNFSPSHHMNAGKVTFQDIKPYTCRDMGSVDVSGVSPVDCSAANEKGGIQSFRFRMIPFQDGDIGSIPHQDVAAHSLLSDCYIVQAASDPSSINSNGLTLNVPMGNNQVNFVTAVEAFLAPNCDGQAGIKVMQRDKGLNAPSGVIGGGSLVHISNSLASIFVHTSDIDMCNSYQSNGSYPFAGGDGSTDAPYGLCNPRQFNEIGNTYVSDSFRLLKDINFLPAMAGVGNAYAAACANMGDTVVPIGGTYVNMGTCSGGNTHSPYTGTFYGNNKTLSNVFIDEGSLDYVGLFRELASVAQVFNLNINNIDIRGAKYVGGLTGKSMATIMSVNIDKANIESNEDTDPQSYLGGIAGEHSTGNISYSSVKEAYIEGDKSYVGGLVGEHSSGTIQSSYFAGVAMTNNSMVGGISGASTGTLNKVFSEGSVIGPAFVGGISGKFEAGTTVTNIYSNAAVVSNGNPQGSNKRVGGLVGEHASTTGINFGIFTGVVSHNCQVTPTTCKIGEIIGDDTSGGASHSDILAVQSSSTDFGGDMGTTVTQSVLRASHAAGGWTGWTQIVGDYPRLDFETGSRDCALASNVATVATQFGNGRGSNAANPIHICHRDQFADISSYDDKHFKLLAPINLRNDTLPYSLDNVANFQGTLDGQGYPIMGYNPDLTTPNNHALFSSITSSGVMKNITMVGSQVLGSLAANTDLAFLTETNNGILENIQIIGGLVMGQQDIGAIAVANSGDIIDSQVDVEIQGLNNIGGIVSVNTGTIHRTVSRMRFNLFQDPTGVNTVGGVVAVNGVGAVISETGFDGQIESKQTVSGQNIGGIAGQNLALIEDVHLSHHALVRADNSDNVGGIVGINTGTIDNAFASGKVVYDGLCTNNTMDNATSCTGGPTWTAATVSEYGPITGENSGTVNNSLYRFPPIQDEMGITDSVNSIPSYTTATGVCNMALATGFGSVDPNAHAFIPSSGLDIHMALSFHNTNLGPIDLQSSDNDCANITNGQTIQLVNTRDSSTIPVSEGTRMSWINLTDINNYPASWDIILDGPGPDFNRLLDLHLAEMLGDPRPANAPIWTVESDGLAGLTLDY